jgi:hypothetical protein
MSHDEKRPHTVARDVLIAGIAAVPDEALTIANEIKIAAGIMELVQVTPENIRHFLKNFLPEEATIFVTETLKVFVEYISESNANRPVWPSQATLCRNCGYLTKEPHATACGSCGDTRFLSPFRFGVGELRKDGTK